MSDSGKSQQAVARRATRRALLLPEVTRLLLEGKSYREIATIVGVSYPAIFQWVKRLRDEQLEQAKTNVDEWTAKLLARYEHVYAEAMKAWHKSELDKVQEKTETKDLVPGDASLPDPPMAKERKRSRRRENQYGDAALLGRAMDALGSIRALKGLDAPKRTELTGPGGGPIQAITRDMTDEQLLAIIAQEAAQQQALPAESTPLSPPLPPPDSPETAVPPPENA